MLWLGVAGTVVTAAALAALCHLLFGLDWRTSLLIGTALSPTDPAVVFSVLGRREIAGRSGTLLEGGSGANDPVGIALKVRSFHGALSSLGEISVFVVLGLTVSLRSLPAGHAWLIGLVLAVLLALLVRPLLVGALLLPVRLTWGERGFVLWAGLKGAVPILLGTFVVAAGGSGTTRVYDIIFVVVLFSVIVQGGLVPRVAGRLGVQMER